MGEPVTFLDGRVVLHPVDCREAIAGLPENSIDSGVMDPPYSLVSIVKRFGKEGSAEAKSSGATGVYRRASAGFMGKRWDTGETAFDPEFWSIVLRAMKPGAHLVSFSGTRTYHRMASAVEDAGFEIRDQIAWTFGSGFPKSHNQGNGWGTALKPAWEPIVLARKPLSEKTVAANVLKWGTGALNIDGCRVATAPGDKGDWPITDRRNADVTYTLAPVPTDQSKGRWPANLCHDGSEEVLAGFPESRDGVAGKRTGQNGVGNWGYGAQNAQWGGYGGEGSAARFFYTAKADSNDRIGSKHPTVKPVDLMRWLVRLVTPPGGTVLDPFAGTGTTAEAAFYEGFNAILCEREAEYIADIERRMKLCLAGPDERRREIVKAKGEPDFSGTLFEGVAP